MTTVGAGVTQTNFRSQVYPRGSNVCFSFWYHMAGDTSLQFSLSMHNEVIWRITGDLGHMWHHGQIKMIGDGSPKSVRIEIQ